MPTMSKVEAGYCRSGPWRFFARRAVLPWALQGEVLQGRVLEVGSGSGAMAAQVAETFPRIELTATDLDPSMLAVAEGRLDRFGSRVKVQPADATDLDFPAASFDVVLSFIMLHHVIHWERALAEAARVLRPGGLFIGYDLLANPPMRLLHWLERSPHRLMRLDELATALVSLPLAECRVKANPALVRLRAQRA